MNANISLKIKSYGLQLYFYYHIIRLSVTPTEFKMAANIYSIRALRINSRTSGFHFFIFTVFICSWWFSFVAPPSICDCIFWESIRFLKFAAIRVHSRFPLHLSFLLDGSGVPTGLLKARAGIVLNTSNTSEKRENDVFGDPLEDLARLYL
jgi:hypothetical protein